MSVGIPPLPPVKNRFGRREEKGIDVWLALEMPEEGEVLTSEVFSIKNGYGLIKYPLFHYTSVIGGDFNELREGDEVEFVVGKNESRRMVPFEADELEMPKEGEVLTSQVYSIKNGYGFIKYPPNNLFFHYTSVIGGDFNELREGDEVEFVVGKNESRRMVPFEAAELEMPKEGEVLTSQVYSIKNGYGFIKYPPNNLFLHYRSVHLWMVRNGLGNYL